jgi:cell division septum initiation protein DivIVA
MSSYYSDDDETAPASDRFGDAIALCQIALNAKTIQANLKKMRKLEADISTASETLARLQDQAAGILERANAEADQTGKACFAMASATRASLRQ